MEEIKAELGGCGGTRWALLAMVDVAAAFEPRQNSAPSSWPKDFLKILRSSKTSDSR